MATIEIRGLDELRRRLSEATAHETLVRPMRRSLLRLQARMADYPPQRVGSTYRRTGTLGRRWTSNAPRIQGTASGLQGRIGNNTGYGPFVQSERFQIPIHRNRWQTDRDVLDDEMPRIIDDFERAIQEALGD